jgi:hypothetical protein
MPKNSKRNSRRRPERRASILSWNGSVAGGKPLDKGLARLGDAFVNLAFSYAKTKVKGRPCGEKVPDRVLSRALELSKVPFPSRLDHGSRGDIVEATLARSWMRGALSLDEAVATLAVELSISDAVSESRAMEREAAARAFSRLLRLAIERLGEAGEVG